MIKSVDNPSVANVLSTDDKKIYRIPRYLGNRRMAKALGYFANRLEDEVEGLDRQDALSKLVDMVSHLCSAVFVQIDVDSHADA